MNLKNLTTEQMDEFAFLPEEAIAALQAGEEWEFQPDSVDGSDADVYYCDDCGDGTWHQVWSVFGLRLDADGTLYETEWTVDTDGNWDFSDEYEYGTYDHAKAYEGVRARWKEYAAWVAKTGKDPLCNYFVPRTTKEKWQFRASDSSVGIKVVVRRNSRGEWVRLSDAPEEVRAFFNGLEEFKSVADLRERGHADRWQRGGKGIINLTRSRSQATMKRDLKARATAQMNGGNNV